MPQIRFLSADDVAAHLTMPLCMEAMAQAAKAVSNKSVNAPLRTFAPLPGETGVLAIMPAATADLPVFGLKALSLLPGNAAKGSRTIQGFVSLFDSETGAVCAIIDGASITAVRTAAASGLATKTLGRDGAETHGILGTGVQAQTHAKAILAVRPNIKETRIWGRDQGKSSALAKHLQQSLNANVVAVDRAHKASCCDIVSAVTGTTEPLIHRDHVSQGAHLNLVGSHTPDKREACSDTMAAARIYVDGLDAAFAEAGDLLIPLGEGRLAEDGIVGELGEVLLGRAPGRQSAADITVYKSLGNAAQDLFAGWALYQSAAAKGAGQSVHL